MILSAGPGPKDLARQILEHQKPQYKFPFSSFLLQTYRFGIPPDQPVCKAFQQGHCPLGNSCPDKHIIASTSKFNNLVCKHWLRGLCKKGDHCEFLHEYNLRGMPECNFFTRNGYCNNGDECLYLHLDPMSKQSPCPHYDKGFCPLGPRCSRKHVRRTLCKFYLAGFCPDGRQCTEGAHPRWPKDLLPPVVKVVRTAEEIAEEQDRLRQIGEEREQEERERYGFGNRGGRGGYRPRGGDRGNRGHRGYGH